MRRVWVLGLALAATACNRGRALGERGLASLALDAQQLSDVRALSSAKGYGGIRVGPGGTMEPHYVALRRLAASPRALEALHFVVERGVSPGGRLMALTGLHHFDREAYERAAALIDERDERVDVQVIGCLGGLEEVGEVIEHPDAPPFLADDTLDSFYERNGAEYFPYDIAGGSYPALFFAEPFPPRD
jgi:hypothetical protein